ncbi:hypothetical protein CKF54_08045, partial [Psittacicella hinzii]
MNNIYKLKFNKKAAALTAVSELATNAVTGKSANTASKEAASTSKLSKFLRNCSILTTSSILTLGSLAFSTGVQADLSREGLKVVHGNVQQITEGLVTTYKTDPNTIINWEKFNIKNDEIVKFLQQNSNTAVLNRVLGGQVSQILGQLQSNGQVFIVNPAGIVFGQ